MASSAAAALWHEETRPDGDGVQRTRRHHSTKATKSHLTAVRLALGQPEFRAGIKMLELGSSIHGN